MAKRGPFVLLQDMTGRIQAYADKDVQKALKLNGANSMLVTSLV